MSRTTIIALSVGGLALVAGAFWALSSQLNGSVDRITPENIAFGKKLYTEQCASCHGANLEGQSNWRQRRADGRLPAPPHDASGHTWHHPDEMLFRITKEGTEALVGGDYKSDMRGFGDVLSDEEIRAVLGYIKSTWPEEQRTRQERVSQNQ